MTNATANHEDRWNYGDRCQLGYEEHDGSAYCFAHGGFALVAARIRRCDRARARDASSGSKR